MADLQGRTPPYHREAEASVLGGCFISPEAVAQASDRLRPEDFFVQQHRLIFEAILALFSAGKPIDLVTMTDELTRRGHLEGIGGIAYLSEIAGFVPSAANVSNYIDIVREKSLMRQIMDTATHMIDQAADPSMQSNEVLDAAGQQIFGLALSPGEQTLQQIFPTVLDVYEQVDMIYRGGSRITGVPTGIPAFDAKTTGLHPSELIILAARPSMGKSSLAMNIAHHVSVKHNLPCAYFSLEMPRDQLVQRLLAAEAMVELQKMRTGALDENDWGRLMEGMARLGNAPLYIDDTPGISVMQMRSKCRRLKMERGLSLVVVDYLQLMSGDPGSRKESQQQEINAISRGLKALAREMDVPVIALSQLSRAPESRNDHRPQLADLRDSGAIEQDADVVLFIYRDWVYDRENANEKEAELIISKQRNGPLGTIDLYWHSEYTLFTERAKEQH